MRLGASEKRKNKIDCKEGKLRFFLIGTEEQGVIVWGISQYLI